MFVKFCEELENCLEEAGNECRMLFNKYPVSPIHDKYKTKFDAISPNGREFRFEFVFRNDNHLTGEVADRAFKTVRDVAVFTNKRLIVKDVQGLIWTKVEMYSLPYSAVNMWSTENAGILDYTAEVELWTRSGHIKIELKRGIDIREFER